MTALQAPPTTDPTRRPSARRFARPGWRDARLWLGLVLLTGSMLAGALVLADRSDTVVVLRAGRDLSAGAALADLRPVAVPVAVAAGYLQPGDDESATLRWPVAAGDLVPRAALVAEASVPSRSVTVPVEPMHLPATLAAGDLVDVWSTPSPGSGDAAVGSRLVLAGVQVTKVAAADGLAGAVGVTLRVPQAQAGRLVQAARGAVVDLVAIPLDAQPPVAGSVADPMVELAP